MNFFLVAILVFISPTLSEIREDLLLPFPKLRSIFSKLKKRQGDGGYLEQCGIVDFGERKLGTVNVLAFFDAAWQYSHRQAAMLKELKGRFERSGMVDINFFVINSTPTTIVEQGEIEIEEDTWKAISPIEAEGFPLVETSLESLNKTLGPEFYLIEDNSQLQIWKKLHVSRDQILVVDGCGKLTYQVIVPWSILHFPYVKAAILSTYKDEACGPCNNFSGDIMKKDEPEDMKEEVKTDERTTKRLEMQEITTEELKISDGEATIPLKIEEPSTGGITTDGTTIPLGIEERTTEEIKTADDKTTMSLEIEEETTEKITTTDGTTTIQLENTERTTEQIKIDRTVTIISEIEETTTEQLKKGTAIPSDIEEEIKRANGATTRLENQEITTEQAQRDVTITISEEVTTTEPLKTSTRTISSDMEEKTTEEMKKADHATTSRLENQAITTEQTQNDDTMTIPSKIEETTTEELKTEAITAIPLIVEEEPTKEMKRADDETKTRLENQAITTEQTQKDCTMTIPSKIEETTTEELKTETIAAILLIVEEEPTEEMERADDATTTRLENQAIVTEQTQKDRAMTILSKIEETTTEELKTEAITAIPLIVDEETTEEMNRPDDATTTRLENQEITTEQIQKDGTMTIPTKIEETTTEELKTGAVTAIPSIKEAETREEIKRADDATRTQLENHGITTDQTQKDGTVTIPTKIETTTTEELKTEAVTAIPSDTQEEIKGVVHAATQIENQEITTQKTNTDKTIIIPSEVEEKTTEEMKTEFLENDDFKYQENDKNSEQTEQKTETLKPTLDLENNSEDLEHILSKFPNVRTISTEIYKNQIGLDQNFENGSNESAENPKDLPIRIILRAPHLDIYENSLIKHDYLILRTGDPDLHDHIDRGIKIDSLDGKLDFEEGSADFENSDIWKIENRDFLNQKEFDVKIKYENETRNGWYGFRVEIDHYNDNNNDNKDSRKIKKKIFGKDESPGLYGEVADYWRNDGIEIFYDEAFDNEEDDKFYDMEKDQNDDSEISDVFKSENSFDGTEEQNASEDQKDKNVVNSINNVSEEEARSKLIAHYSKLLPWIYYVLN